MITMKASGCFRWATYQSLKLSIINMRSAVQCRRDQSKAFLQNLTKILPTKNLSHKQRSSHWSVRWRGREWPQEEGPICLIRRRHAPYESRLHFGLLLTPNSLLNSWLKLPNLNSLGERMGQDPGMSGRSVFTGRQNMEECALPSAVVAPCSPGRRKGCW